MKLKPDFKSIKFKTWAYFILFAIAIMVVLWFFQIVFFTQFYGSMKTYQAEEVISDIKESYKTSSEETFRSDVASYSSAFDMYIYIGSADGTATYFNPSGSHDGTTVDLRNITAYPQLKYFNGIAQLNRELIESKDRQASIKIPDPSADGDVSAYAVVLTDKKHVPYIVYIFSPSWPVSSTVKILTNQLIYVTVLSLLLACLLSLYLSTRITRPIRKITSSAKRLAMGEYGVVFNGGHYTEIDNLADTLTSASIELEKSTSLQKDLIANVSHDLKTPLTMIKSYAEMIHDISGDNPAKREEHLQVIMDESDRLNNLVNDMLTITRLQSGKLTIEKSNFNVTNAVHSILNTYNLMAEEDGYTINFDCPADYIVNADKDKIQQVISNLITNAIKFCGEDKTINVSLHRHGRFVQFRVEDHGEGISPDDLNHIWERYYRSSSNMVRTSEGTGLGLSICKEILSLHKVKFGVSSKLGEGSVFWFDMEYVSGEMIGDGIIEVISEDEIDG